MSSSSGRYNSLSSSGCDTHSIRKSSISSDLSLCYRSSIISSFFRLSLKLFLNVMKMVWVKKLHRSRMMSSTFSKSLDNRLTLAWYISWYWSSPLLFWSITYIRDQKWILDVSWQTQFNQKADHIGGHTHLKLSWMWDQSLSHRTPRPGNSQPGKPIARTSRNKSNLD